jgi:cytochrome c553
MRRDRLCRPGARSSMKSLYTTLLAATAAAAVPCGPIAAADAQAGRQKAIACQTCHGMDGMSKIPEAPNLAGQVEIYLEKSLKDYRAGERKNEMMTLVAKELSDEDIANLAAYYASIQIEVVPR